MIVCHSLSVGVGMGHIVVPQTSAMCSNSPCKSDDLISLNGSPSNTVDASLGDCTESLHPFVGPSDGMGGSAPVQANSQPGRVLPAVSQRSVGPCRGGSHPDPKAVLTWGQGALRRMMMRTKAMLAAIEACWIGDLIGVLALFGLLIIGLILGHGGNL